MRTYFISDGKLVKIGRSCDVKRRCATFQTAIGQPLTVLLDLPGNREQELHQRFAEHRTRGEWFVLAFEIRQFIAEQNGMRLRPPFREWLEAQRHRCDDVGRFAVVALAVQPAHGFNRLASVLACFEHRPRLRSLAKLVHARYRAEAR